MKRSWILILMLSLMFVFTGCSGGGGGGDNDEKSDGIFFYTLENDCVTLTGLTDYGRLLTSLNLPETIEGYPVTRIKVGEKGFGWFSGFADALVIPDSVIKIDGYAFISCSGFSSLTIGSGVTTIGECAFLDCHSFTSLTIGSSVNSIDWSAFSQCSNLTSIKVERILAPSLGEDVFQDCNNLTEIKVPATAVSAYKAAPGWSSFSGIISGY